MVERRDQPAVATFFHDGDFASGPFQTGEVAKLIEAQAHHVAVRRLAVGDPVTLRDGRGRRGHGVLESVAAFSTEVRVETVEIIPPPSPLELYLAVADLDRTLLVAEKAVEVGVTAWRPVFCARSASVRPRAEGKKSSERLMRRMVAALLQSGGAWLPAIHDQVELSLAAQTSRGTRVVCDRAGGPIATVNQRGGVAVLVGPEGGLESTEQSILDDAGWARVSPGPTTLRFETAAIVAIGALRALGGT